MYHGSLNGGPAFMFIRSADKKKNDINVVIYYFCFQFLSTATDYTSGGGAYFIESNTTDNIKILMLSVVLLL